jgi:hypothetical protein
MLTDGVGSGGFDGSRATTVVASVSFCSVPPTVGSDLDRCLVRVLLLLTANPLTELLAVTPTEVVSPTVAVVPLVPGVALAITVPPAMSQIPSITRMVTPVQRRINNLLPTDNPKPTGVPESIFLID